MSLISCITVTKRPEFIKNVVRMFDEQTYKNRELIIHCDGEEVYQRIKDIAVDREDITVSYSVGKSLGEKRNLAIESSSGKYFIIWDDDDIYHETRIEKQYNAIISSGKNACTLKSLSCKNLITNEVYVTHDRSEGWEGSLMCERDVKVKYVHQDKGEDSPLIRILFKNNMLTLIDEPDLYVYQFHGTNTFDSDHFDRINSEYFENRWKRRPRRF